ncbi:MAG TPA: hypothetical protein DCW44_00425 [Eubacterium sp.]|nr:hypothetical protein [Eubacterium sp.]
MKYIIHACNKRLWYVNNFIIPSMVKQKIKKSDILVWLDKECAGVLESCMQCFDSLPDNDENVWHLQDDILICRDFKKQTESFKNYDGIVCGLSVLDMEDEYETGETNVQNFWYSFPCIMIPNKIAKECARWFEKNQFKKQFVNWIISNKGDDYIFKFFIEAKHPDIKIYNICPNIVNHIDDLIGGTTHTNKRPNLLRSKYWYDDELTEELEKELEVYMNKNKKVALYTGTRNLYPGMIASVMSLVKHSSVDKVYLLIEDDSIQDYIDEPLPDYIVCMNVSEEYKKYFKEDSPNMTSRFTYMALMRATVAKLFKQYDKMLVLDCDIIVNENIDELWNIDITDYYFAAAAEPDCCKGGKYEKMDFYTNIGVCLYNLKKLREDKIVDKVIKRLNERKYDFMEQDCFNEVCQGYIYDLPSTYNGCNYTIPCNNPKITHFAAVKDWQNKPIVEKYMNMNFKDMRRK